MSHQGTSCGEICSPRLLRFYSLHTTINYNKQTCLTSKSGAHHPLLSHSLVGGSVFARTAAKGYFHCEGHLQQLAQVFFFLPALHQWTWNPSPGTTMVIDSFFSGGMLSGRSTRDTGVVPARWIIDPMPGGKNVEVTAVNDKKDALEPLTPRCVCEWEVDMKWTRQVD